jgi:uncharacterized DUF497 family protein
VRVEFDPAKREKTLAERRIDFARAGEVFAGRHLTAADTRSYSEARDISVGRLDGRLVVIVWTPRGEARRMTSMRKAKAREQAKCTARLEGPG